MYDIILFDLDGTLSDSGPGIMHSVRYALAKYGITGESDAALRRFVGPPMIESFMKFYGFSHEQAVQALAYYREDYLAGAIYMNTPYEGMEETLRALKARGKILAAATGKPTPMAEDVLRHFGWEGYFAFIAGATMDESRSEKHDIINYALEALRESDKSRVLMVGDRDNDVFGAEKAGVACCGVLWGYGSRGELEGAGAKYIIEKPEDLLGLV
ncbi:MAG: HAD-IA family hydrolase [Lachnospiraceae bacterium]|nr:HAD-IA family hydrolase [Lachnospiraceae bacterium]